MKKQLREQILVIEELMNSGFLEDAIAQLEELSQQYPDNYHIASLLGECYLTTGKPEKAIRPLQWATKRFESEVIQQEEEAEQEALLPLKSTEDEEEDHLIEQLRADASPEDLRHTAWVDHYLLGCAYGRCLKFRHAIRHLNIADKLNPENSEIIRNMGWIRCLQKKKDTGRKLLKRAIDLDPHNALAYNDMGASYLFEEKFDEAKKWIDEAVKIDPNDEFILKTVDKLEELTAYQVLFRKKSPKSSS